MKCFSIRDPFAPLVALCKPSQARATKVHSRGKWITHGKLFHGSEKWFHTGNAFPVEKSDIWVWVSCSILTEEHDKDNDFQFRVLGFLGICLFFVFSRKNSEFAVFSFWRICLLFVFSRKIQSLQFLMLEKKLETIFYKIVNFFFLPDPIPSHHSLTYPGSFPSILDIVSVHFLANFRSIASNILDQRKHWITDNTHIMVLRPHRHHYSQCPGTSLQSTAQLPVLDPQESHFQHDPIFPPSNSGLLFGTFCGRRNTYAELFRITWREIQQLDYPTTKSKTLERSAPLFSALRVLSSLSNLERVSF